MRKLIVVTLLVWLNASLLLGAVPGGVLPDEVIIRYPQGYTKLLVADLAKILADPVLSETFIGPLRAARHPLNGIAQTVETLRLDPSTVQFVAHGEGPQLTPFSLLQGPAQEATMGALFGLKFAVGAPGSPFTNWDLLQSNGLPVVRTGGDFGPVKIQWAYVPTADALWVGTEVGFGAEPDLERLEATTALITARVRGQGAYFDELPVALGARGGDLAFVRRTDPSLDRPVTAGEQALGFALSFTPEGARVAFDVRFSSAKAAAEALAALQAGTSPYLAQDLYQGQLVRARQVGTELLFTVDTDLKGAVGLVLVVMPN